MIEEFLHNEFRPSTLDHSHYRRQTVVRPPDTTWVWAFGNFDPVALLGAPSSGSLKRPLTKRAPRHAETWSFSPLSAIRRIVAAIRLRCARTSSQQQLRELNDHMLRASASGGEEVGDEFPKSFWHRD
jgi:hypothetical protein